MAPITDLLKQAMLFSAPKCPSDLVPAVSSGAEKSWLGNQLYTATLLFSCILHTLDPHWRHSNNLWMALSNHWWSSLPRHRGLFIRNVKMSLQILEEKDGEKSTSDISPRTAALLPGSVKGGVCPAAGSVLPRSPPWIQCLWHQEWHFTRWPPNPAHAHRGCLL